MPLNLAKNVITDWGSYDEKNQRDASEIILDYQRDRKIEDLIEITEIDSIPILLDIQKNWKN